VNDRHRLNLAELVDDRVALRLPAITSLLDVGTGSGKVARELTRASRQEDRRSKR